MEFGFESDFECGEVAECPVEKRPFTLFSIVTDTDEEVEGVVLDFVGSGAWFKIKCAE